MKTETIKNIGAVLLLILVIFQHLINYELTNEKAYRGEDQLRHQTMVEVKYEVDTLRVPLAPTEVETPEMAFSCSICHPFSWRLRKRCYIAYDFFRDLFTKEDKEETH